MRVSGRRRSIIFFITLGACLVVLAVALNIGWILLNWQQVALLILGIIIFGVIIAGLVIHTIFLVREIRLNEQHDSFINAVTHELKTPIASLRLYLETLKTHPVDDDRRREFYDIMLADADRLLHTVEQVLRAGRAGGRRRRHHFIPIDLNKLLPECLELARTRHKLAPDAMSFTDSFKNGERPTVLGDPDELRAAISNLLENAIKYSDQEVRVSVEMASVDKNRIEIRVTDKGIGIPANHLKPLFKRFYRVPRQVLSHEKGSGLGLFIVRSVVKKHGGRAFAFSEGEGHGSTFTIRLPRAEK